MRVKNKKKHALRRRLTHKKEKIYLCKWPPKLEIIPQNPDKVNNEWDSSGPPPFNQVQKVRRRNAEKNIDLEIQSPSHDSVPFGA